MVNKHPKSPKSRCQLKSRLAHDGMLRIALWNPSYITGLTCEVCTEAVLSVALWTRVYFTSLDMCAVCTEAVHSVALWTRVIHHRFGHVCTIYRSSPFHSTLNTSYCTDAVHFRSTLNTSYFTSLDMCAVCTEAVHSVALWTRVASQVWSCVQYVPKQSIALWTRVTSQVWHVWSPVPKQSIPYSTLNTSYMKGLDMCAVCTEAVHSV